MVEQTEQDSAQKVRWSFAMNTPNDEGASRASSCDNMLDGNHVSSTEIKLPKEGTAVIKVAGDFDIFITPLLIEALNRYGSRVVSYKLLLCHCVKQFLMQIFLPYSVNLKNIVRVEICEHFLSLRR